MDAFAPNFAAKIVLPVHVVNVNDLTVRIKVEDAVDGCLNKRNIMADDHEATLIGAKIIA